VKDRRDTVRLKVEIHKIHEIQFSEVTNYRNPRNPPPISQNPTPATKSTATPPKANYRNPPALDGVCLRIALQYYVVTSSRPHSTVNAGILGVNYRILSVASAINPTGTAIEVNSQTSVQFETYAEEKQARCEWFCFDVVKRSSYHKV